MSFNLDVIQKVPPRKLIQYRRIKNIDKAAFCNDLVGRLNSHCIHSNCGHSVDEIAASIFDALRSTLDLHAPQKEHFKTIRSTQPWINDKVFQARRLRRAAECRLRRAFSEQRLQEYKQARNAVVSAIATAKRCYFNKLFSDNARNSKALFRSLSDLLKAPENTNSTLPSPRENENLATSFLGYFESKVTGIRDCLPPADAVATGSSESQQPLSPQQRLSFFRQIDESDIHSIIFSSHCTTSLSDPVPSPIFKACFPSIANVITRFINLSLETGTVPVPLKSATIRPILKRGNLDPAGLASYRPISTLPFLSKVLEKVVLAQIKEHLQANGVLDPFQSAYRSGYSTETAMVRVQNDILQCLDQKENAILALLDLSAAFDTVDHAVLLDRLSRLAGVGGSALLWIKSYLTERLQRVAIDELVSNYAPVRYGVPQGSVLGPVLFSIYLLPLRSILKELSVNYHLYADDTQLYMSVDPLDPQPSFDKIEHVIQEIAKWMSRNFLKLNQAKTEFMLISSRFSRRPISHTFDLGQGESLEPVCHVRDLGAFLSSDMSVDKQVSMTCRSTCYALRELRRVRRYLTVDATHAAVRALVISRLDFHNALLYGAPSYQLQRLQRVQNMAARLVMKADKRDSATDILRHLHWLPVEARISYKICLLTFHAVNAHGPTYLQELVQFASSGRVLRSSKQQCMLVVPKSRSVSFGDRSFTSAAPRLWNSLPEELRTSRSESHFKRLLKTYLFRKFLG